MLCVYVFRNRQLDDPKPSATATGEPGEVQQADMVRRRDHREDGLCRVRARRKGLVPGTVALHILHVFLLNFLSLCQVICSTSRCVYLTTVVYIYLD